MTEKPGKPEGGANTEPEREEPPPPRRAETAARAPEQKKKPGDAARKMRAMFKGG